MKKLFIPFLFALTFALGACGGVNPDPTPIDPTQEITVNYYLDYNQIVGKNVYQTVTVKNGSKLTKPLDPTTPVYPEFPVFKGWSSKEIIDDTKDLWDFSKDTVRVTSGSTFSLFGIWVSAGE